ncbi:FKBP-type peptidyl-prolyl cis-trans isomerase [Flavobacterium caeni]|uniref:Uncharacterized protein n=1 Tax=Flavobacterium caeni TaxID=490189 RepID=A0A1G5HTL8_9FLAO|nr:hypothetical protein [Flavobacterium caeni]SCY67097.1 hypothetical protein SAMN02927903_02001 [Flavobacterium caeni]
MSKFKFYFLAFATLSVLFSCDKNNNSVDYEILQDYGVQYTYDLSVIEDYLKTHYIEEIVNNPGGVDDQDIKLSPIPEGGTQEAIWDSPLLHFVDVERHTMTYRIYYIKQREGAGDQPSRVDRVLTSYDGAYLKMGEEPTRFEYVQTPTSYLPLHSVIVGWSEIFRLFKDGNLVENPGNPATFEDFGAGVMFVPSGLAYYNQATSTIPKYAQLMFKFKLYDVKLDDQDGDGIYSNDEDINGDGFFDDDSDGDGIVDYQDTDDDGDGHLTRNEIKNASGELYDFNLIPDCSGDTSNPDRLKRHLDPACTKENE